MAKEGADKKKEQKVRRPQAQKRDITSGKRRLMNKAFRSSARTAIRNFEDSLEKGEQAHTKEMLNEVYSIMDKGVKRGVFKLNKASRTKERLAARAVAKT